jgi:hypothetical protein
MRQMPIRIKYMAVLLPLSLIFIQSIYAESVFLKNGTIVEGKIISEINGEIAIQQIDNKTQTLKSSDVLRTIYSDEYKKMVNIIKLNGESIQGFIVAEDSSSYTVRIELNSAKEIQILKKEVNGILKKVKQATQTTELILKTEKEVYAPYEQINVDYENFPGSKYDWISIAPKDSPNEYYESYFYTGRKKSGRLTFQGVIAGEYEVRAYLHWAQGSYQVDKRVKFIVK